MRLLLMGLGVFFQWSVLASEPDKNCSLLLSAIEATEAKIASSKQAGSLTSQNEKWTLGSESMGITYENGKVTLVGGKQDISLLAELSRNQINWLKKITKSRADIFGPTLDRTSQRDSLREAIQSSKLHAAFYQEIGHPLQAAKEMEALVDRSSKQHYHVKVKITEAATQGQFLDNIGKFADGLSGIADLHQRGKLEGAVQNYQQEQQAKRGAQLLESMLNPQKEVTIDQTLEATEKRKRENNPEAVELTVEYGHDEPRVVHLERGPTGQLKVTPRGSVGFQIKNLRQLVDWLQGKGFDGKSYDWRSYEPFEEMPFKN